MVCRLHVVHVSHYPGGDGRGAAFWPDRHGPALRPDRRARIALLPPNDGVRVSVQSIASEGARNREAARSGRTRQAVTPGAGIAMLQQTGEKKETQHWGTEKGGAISKASKASIQGKRAAQSPPRSRTMVLPLPYLPFSELALPYLALPYAVGAASSHRRLGRPLLALRLLLLHLRRGVDQLRATKS